MYGETQKKGFKITIYGVADYNPDEVLPDQPNFVNFINKQMEKYLIDLQTKLKDKGSFNLKSTLSNCEILGHGNKDYPEITTPNK
jgi:hypothetical protein